MMTFLKVLNAILAIFQSYQSNKKTQKKDEQVAHAQTDTVDFYNSHFSDGKRLHSDTDETDSSS